MSDIKYPATQTVHCPSGPTNACDGHAEKLKSLMAFMGAHSNSTPLEQPAECDNCVNEAGKVCEVLKGDTTI